MNFKIGPGSDSEIIGCNFDLLSPALNIWTMMTLMDQEWTWDFVSSIPVSPDPDTSTFLPLLNFSIGDEEYYFFLRNEDTVVGFRSADTNLWHSKVFFSKFDATPIDFSPLGFQFIQGSSLGFESLQFTAVSVGPRTFKLEEDYTNNDEGNQLSEFVLHFYNSAFVFAHLFYLWLFVCFLKGTKKLAKQHRGVGKLVRERDKAKRFVLYGLSHPIVCVTNACLILTGCDLCSVIHILGFTTNNDRGSFNQFHFNLVVYLFYPIIYCDLTCFV